MYATKAFSNKRLFVLFIFLASADLLTAQTKPSLQDLSFFQSSGPNWKIASDVQADLWQDRVFTPTDGTGILVNIPGDGALDLFTKDSYGDMDIELDYMMAKNSNSGVYFQGRYEIQLFDSWGKINPGSGDNGGIYERWDDARQGNNKGYEGTAPRQNVSKAPGLWQHLKASFQAPRFDNNGKKIANAVILNVWLNGALIQENVEVTGPTRAGIEDGELPVAPLRLQGDHGPVAFKSIVITPMNKPLPTLSDLKYWVYNGRFTKEPDYKKLKATITSSSTIVTSAIGKLNNDFLLRYNGSINIKEDGEFTFKINVPGGKGALRIDSTSVIKMTENDGVGKIQLQPGPHSFEIVYAKTVDWIKHGLTLTVSATGLRETLLSDSYPGTGDAEISPILIPANSNTILRSFMDLPDGNRITHAVNVGSPTQTHYTYDLDKGMIVQAWHGRFLDATPMWHERGDGSSRPVGAAQFFGSSALSLAKLTNEQSAWPLDTAGSNYRPKGYTLNGNDQPTFRYIVYGAEVNDASVAIDGGKGLRREISVTHPPDGLFALLAGGTDIKLIGDGLYIVNDKSYYIKIDDAGTAKPLIRQSGGRQELIVPIQKKIVYSIIF